MSLDFSKMAVREIFNISEKVLDEALDNISSGKAYHYWPMAKKRGGYRIISSPSEPLKIVQKKIQRKLAEIPIHASVEGFRKGHSIKTNIQKHLEMQPRCMLNIDLEEAFPSTNRQKVRTILINFMDRKTAKILGIDKDDIELDDLIKETTEDIASFILSLLVDCGSIPQGSPASPVLLNIACFKLDQDICRILPSGYVYTRYADDLTVSCKFKSMDPKVIKEIEDAIHSSGYVINKKKQKYTVLKGGNNTLEVTGLVISGKKIEIPKRQKNSFENTLYFLSKKESFSMKEWNRVWGIIEYIRHIYGGAHTDIPRWAGRHINAISKIPVHEE